MILLSELLDEDGEAAQQAKQMGLISKGWGRWADPRTGKVTHKTDGGQLVAVDPQQDKSGGEKEIGPKPSQSKLGQIAKDLKGKASRASTKRQRAKAGADADFDAVEKLRQITSSPQDFEKASKMYHQGHDMKDIEAQFGNKKKPSKYDDPKYKKGDWWDDPELQDEPDDFERQMMAKTSADRAAKKAKRDAEFKKDNEKWADARAKKFQEKEKKSWWKDMDPKDLKKDRDSLGVSTGDKKTDMFMNAVETKIHSLYNSKKIKYGEDYSVEEWEKLTGIPAEHAKKYDQHWRDDVSPNMEDPYDGIEVLIYSEEGINGEGHPTITPVDPWEL